MLYVFLEQKSYSARVMQLVVVCIDTYLAFTRSYIFVSYQLCSYTCLLFESLYNIQADEDQDDGNERWNSDSDMDIDEDRYLSFLYFFSPCFAPLTDFDRVLFSSLRFTHHNYSVSSSFQVE